MLRAVYILQAGRFYLERMHEFLRDTVLPPYFGVGVFTIIKLSFYAGKPNLKKSTSLAKRQCPSLPDEVFFPIKSFSGKIRLTKRHKMHLSKPLSTGSITLALLLFAIGMQIMPIIRSSFIQESTLGCSFLYIGASILGHCYLKLATHFNIFVSVHCKIAMMIGHTYLTFDHF